MFRKDIPKICRLCQHAMPVNARDMLCGKLGAVGGEFSCRRFRYDPTKRQPVPKMKLDASLDFKIE